MDNNLICVYNIFFFFFKQKTAYEMRISDWSSDVCSSDLRRGNSFAFSSSLSSTPSSYSVRKPGKITTCPVARKPVRPVPSRRSMVVRSSRAEAIRSEEHTSELQSLMRISYAVFCLKKKKTKDNTTNHKCKT